MFLSVTWTSANPLAAAAHLISIHQRLYQFRALFGSPFMRDHEHVPPPPGAGASASALQFDEATFSTDQVAPLAVCSVTGQPITSDYYEVNGKIVLPHVMEQIRSHFDGGSGAARFGKALVFGGGASIAAIVAWGLVITLTGYELGILAVAAGWLIGTAVRNGSCGRGGWLYRIMALSYTWLAIGLSHFVIVYREISADGGSLLANGIIAIILSFISPIFVFVDFSILGVLIYAFAFWEAWKLTGRAELAIRGPFYIQQSQVNDDQSGTMPAEEPEENRQVLSR